MITVTGIEAAMQHIRHGRAIRASGVGGMLTVKRSELSGRWACFFLRAGEITEATFDLKLDVHRWLREYFPRCRVTALHPERKRPASPFYGRAK